MATRVSGRKPVKALGKASKKAPNPKKSTDPKDVSLPSSEEEDPFYEPGTEQGGPDLDEAMDNALRMKDLDSPAQVVAPPVIKPGSSQKKRKVDESGESFEDVVSKNRDLLMSILANQNQMMMKIDQMSEAILLLKATQEGTKTARRPAKIKQTTLSSVPDVREIVSSPIPSTSSTVPEHNIDADLAASLRALQS
ncbi:hypothetical protein 1 [Beihai rhabdo-like virus 3]|uniref:Uncharacterized protein n=1 Tax=Beihai rhabdo-like virus 3 TaxID=1922653 RepID=A0A1L3KMK4_9MONO|nr:hypothetical protein 1 [Beihai rhabdo-like virus 3]APG78651.1 hypothetical protein 1 [Beihai rhabdo-like virus 3]